jgi:EAL domain-containing protein (putative c-di-GMP-specific phosphodiesterase class I)
MTFGDEVFLDGNPVLHFQPAVDLATGRLLGFEALVRWQDSQQGLIPPNVLLPWAEKNGYILNLNAWVLSEACFQAASWPSALQVAVNCSTSQLQEHRTSIAAANALEGSGLNPDRLTIEVTENTVADEQANKDLDELSHLGVHLAVDNVGTSWSTLENLRRFAIETAKIDREFISGLEAHEGMNRAIVEAIIHVIHSLAMTTVAEGIETAEQVAILQEFGADVGQGYFFARPLPSDQAYALANAEPRTVFALTAETEGPSSEGPSSTSIDEIAGTHDGTTPESTPEAELEISRVHVL